jgi:hypothetical protein
MEIANIAIALTWYVVDPNPQCKIRPIVNPVILIKLSKLYQVLSSHGDKLFLLYSKSNMFSQFKTIRMQ